MSMSWPAGIDTNSAKPVLPVHVRILSHPRTHDLLLLACGIAVLAMMVLAIGNMDVPQ